jgi:hypothetical protein
MAEAEYLRKKNIQKCLQVFNVSYVGSNSLQMKKGYNIYKKNHMMICMILLHLRRQRIPDDFSE